MTTPSSTPAAIMARLVAAVPPGSYLTISHPASDVAADQMAQSMRGYNEQARDPLTARTHAQVGRFFEGLDLVEPVSCSCTGGGPAPVSPAPAASWPTTAG
jgi:S-adenosyl methyltransferase